MPKAAAAAATRAVAAAWRCASVSTAQDAATLAASAEMKAPLCKGSTACSAASAAPWLRARRAASANTLSARGLSFTRARI